MSFKSKNVSYQKIVMEEDDENDFEEAVMDEESEIDQNIDIIKKEARENLHFSEINSSYEDKSDNENEDEDENVSSFTRTSESVLIGIKQEWAGENEIASKSLESADSEDERTEFYIDRGTEGEEEDDGEETIAMFVTASGQQLALYAVEDSDDYFAVAVYDESGEPPSNFQFLMKSDVERLIREGAVRTVKKPTQIKKQLVTTQPPVFMHKEEITGDVITRAESQIEAINRRYTDNRKTKVTTNFIKPVVENPPAPKIVRVDDSESEEELVEQSTVQYILCDGDQSDAELTFDEIQATLQSMKTHDPKPVIKKPLVKKSPPEHKKTNNGLLYITSPPIRNTSYRGAYYSSKTVKAEPPLPSRQSPVKRSHLSNTSIIGSKQNHGIKRELSPMSDHCTPNTSTNFSENLTNTNSQSKVKRPRKQQLTSVNRGDSEIIIQPASMLEEEEEEPIPRKKGKRKKKTAPQEKPSKLPTRKSTRRRRSRVEIIDIDVEEEDSDEPTQRKEILEITIDENKEKGSSDKENEVIMVGDSEDEEEGSSKSLSLKCKHCLKNFKQRRTLDSHMRVCTKLRSKSRRWSNRRTRADSDSEEESPKEKKNSKGKRSRESSKEKNSKEKNSKPKKEYSCKTCEEKFDMVVTLARHVRAEHSPRKRGRPSKADAKKFKMQMRVEVTRVGDKKKQESKNVDMKLKEKTSREAEDDEAPEKEKTQKKGKTPEEEEALEEKRTLKEKEAPEEKREPEKKKTSEEKGALKEKEAPQATEVSETKAMMACDKKKLRSNLNRKWRPTELTCIMCNRWFSSVSALETHTLQHLTKKSVRNVHRCPICNKLFESEFVYMKHKMMHAKAKKSSESEKSGKSTKTQSEEQATSKVSAVRNRGRPRKVRSDV